MLLLIVCSAVVVSCATAPKQIASSQSAKDITATIVTPNQTENLPPVSAEQIIEQSGLTQQQKDEITANNKLQQYLYLAEQNPPPKKQIYLLLAASQLNRQAKYSDALRIIVRIDYTQLEIKHRFILAILKAEILAAFKKYEDAINALNIVGYISGDINSPSALFLPQSQILRSLSTKQKLIWLAYKATFLELKGDYYNAVLIYIQRGALIKNATQLTDNGQKLWNALNFLTQSQLMQLRDLTNNEELQGWLQLYQISTENSGGIEGQIKKVEQWKRQNPTHTASLNLPKSIQTLYDLQKNLPKTIAIALPISGPIAKYGQAIRDGFMATYFHLHNQNYQVPNLLFYDTATANTDSDITIQSIYRQATDDGADFFIGPLSKDLVRQLLTIDLTIPTLALNSLNQESQQQLANNRKLYQLSLAVESEVEQIATKMAQNQHFKVLAIANQSEVGKRATQKLTELYADLNATSAVTAEVVETLLLSNDNRDFKKQIGELLLVNESQKRSGVIQRIIRDKVEYTPRRRQDVDAIFLALNPTEARQVMPLIRFYLADDLDVYATSSIYSGVINAKLDNDLNGIKFVVMPWLIDSQDPIYKTLPKQQLLQPEQMIFYALGVDVYHLVQRMTQLQQLEKVFYHGAIGTLAIDPNYHINKKLSWAQFQRGQPVLSTKD